MPCPIAGTDRLPRALQQLLRSELQEKEELLWFGQPVAWRSVSRGLFSYLGGIPFVAFGIFWLSVSGSFVAADPHADPDWLVPAGGWLFIFAGSGPLLFLPLHEYLTARRTLYVLTNCGARILRAGVRPLSFLAGFRDSIQTFAPDHLQYLRRNQTPDGTGDLIFEQPPSSGDRHSLRHLAESGFRDVAQVRHVEELVRRIASQSNDGTQRLP